MKTLARYIIESDGITKTAAPSEMAHAVASFLRKSPVVLPALGGVAGAGAMSPFAIRSFREGRPLEGVGQLGVGAITGAGAGFLGREAMRQSHLAAARKDEIVRLASALLDRKELSGFEDPGKTRSFIQGAKALFGKAGEKVKDVVLGKPKPPPTRLEKLVNPKNIGTAAGLAVGAGLSSAEAQRSIEEGNKYKGYTQLGLGALLGGAGGRAAGGVAASPIGRHLFRL